VLEVVKVLIEFGHKFDCVLDSIGYAMHIHVEYTYAIGVPTPLSLGVALCRVG